jgi:hypothetical protein
MNRALTVDPEDRYHGTPIAVEHPDLVRRIAAAGHEAGSHGLSLDLIYVAVYDAKPAARPWNALPS